MYTPCKPQFYYIKVGFKGGQNYIGMFSWWLVLRGSEQIRTSLNGEGTYNRGVG